MAATPDDDQSDLHEFASTDSTTKPHRDPNWLQQNYIDKDLSGAEVAEIAGTSEGAVYAAASEFGIRKTDTEPQTKTATVETEESTESDDDADPIDFERTTLYTLYWTEHLSMSDIAEQIGSKSSDVREAFHEKNIPVRPPGLAGEIARYPEKFGLESAEGADDAEGVEDESGATVTIETEDETLTFRL